MVLCTLIGHSYTLSLFLPTLSECLKFFREPHRKFSVCLHTRPVLHLKNPSKQENKNQLSAIFTPLYESFLEEIISLSYSPLYDGVHTNLSLPFCNELKAGNPNRSKQCQEASHRKNVSFIFKTKIVY